MKKIILTVLLALPLSLFAQNAKIKIDISREIGDIDPKIYGVFMEPIHFNGSLCIRETRRTIFPLVRSH